VSCRTPTCASSLACSASFPLASTVASFKGVDLPAVGASAWHCGLAGGFGGVTGVRSGGGARGEDGALGGAACA
jgi:hypothetical protein